MESFFNSLKNERTHGVRYHSCEEARVDVFEYIEAFYNRKHSLTYHKKKACGSALGVKMSRNFRHDVICIGNEKQGEGQSALS